MFTNIIDDRAKRLTKSLPKKRSIRDVYTREKYQCENLMVKEGGEGVCSKGEYFRELTVHAVTEIVTL